MLFQKHAVLTAYMLLVSNGNAAEGSWFKSKNERVLDRNHGSTCHEACIYSAVCPRVLQGDAVCVGCDAPAA